MKKFVVFGIVFVSLIVLTWYLLSTRVTEAPVQPDMFTQGDPVELTLDVMNDWQANLMSTSSTPLADFLSQPIFSPTLKASLLGEASQPEVDPLLCQTSVPPRVVGRLVVMTVNEAQVLVLARGLETPAPQQSMVTLRGNGEGGWVIAGISCVTGETAPEVEFTFDREGYLLKSVPAPYTTGTWHVVFEQDGQMGYVAPLTFTSDSMCVEPNGTEAVCQPDSLVEPIPALVRGEMTESGVIVSQIRFAEN
jgi:hypothetical protein